MNNLNPQQQAMFKNLILVGMLYLGVKLSSKLARYGIFGYVAFTIYKMNKAGNLAGNDWKMKIDPNLAVDILFPKMSGQEKVFARMAASHVLGAILSPQGPLQSGRI